MRNVAIISQKGGAGKTTLAVHLAAQAEAAGHVSLIVDMDPQTTASQWAAWRGEDRPPEVIDSPPPLLGRKLEQARKLGAGFVVIDTPPHADTAASTAALNADLILIPCRPRAFDLHAVQMTARLVADRRAFVVFTAGPPRAPRLYAEAAEVVQGYGLSVCPVHIPERAAYHHATAEGRTAAEIEPGGKAAEDMAALWAWTCEQLNMPTTAQENAA